MRISLDGGEPLPMQRESGDWFCAELQAAPGTRYSYVLPDGLRVPDPTSRQQAGDVHDPSIVVDPRSYVWRNGDWRGRPWQETVLYEVHVGTLGGFAGVAAQLPHLARTGITAIELMPIADFPGRRNWGYDGVLPYAPDTAYGTPDDLKALIDAAHDYGIMVFLDVVYNHFGPDGAYIHIYAQSFFSDDFPTPWGAGIDFRRTVVQDFFIHNALYWLHEYRFDGLRFDAVGVIEPQEFLATLTARIRAGVEPGRHVHLVMEHEHNAARLLRGSFDAQWTDDIHHAFHVLLTGETSGYYKDFEDATALLVRSLRDGFAYQGQIAATTGRPRGESSTDLPTSCFVAFIQNHDQIGNRAVGDRLTASVDPRALRAARAFILLSPFIPLLFMGEEWGTRTPFIFFTDHNDELAELVRTGRQKEFGAQGGFAPGDGPSVPDPNSIETFAASQLDYGEARRPGPDAELSLTRHLLDLRARYIAPLLVRAQSRDARVLAAGAVIGEWLLDDGNVLRIALNLSAATADCDIALHDPSELPILYATSSEVGRAARSGHLAAASIVVWLGSLARDESLLEIAYS